MAMLFINFKISFLFFFIKSLFHPFLSTLSLLNMSPLDITTLAPKPVSDTKKKIRDAWKLLLTRVEGVAMTFPDDKEELEEEMRYWLNQWSGIMVSASEGVR